MVNGQGSLRPHWQTFMGSLVPLDREAMAEKWDEALRLLRQNGVTYNIYGDPQGIERLWPLDMIPLLIPPDEWRTIEAGVVQRATLLNQILADLYGPQTMIRSGRMPASLLHTDPGFRRCCHGIKVPGNTFLHFCAVDLARGPDGSWWVLADRTETPSGSGYALENRAVIGRILTDSFRHCQVERLSGFFSAFRDTLLGLAPRAAQPRVVLLTPGPYNETYFEHVYLARSMQMTLVEGEDLTVRDRRVYLKTLGGLEPVDVILRRLNDDFCDPLELRADSSLGVAGLLQAVRAGTVAVANAVGSGLLESMSFKAFLPTLCRHFLGEELKLPSVASWWCGQEGELGYVIDHLDRLVIKPAHRGLSLEPIFGADLSGAARLELAQELRRNPWDYVGQEQIALSTAPVWQDGKLQPRPLVLRVFVCHTPDGYRVMPGGLTRVSNEPGRLVVSMQRGGGAKDTWVLVPRRDESSPVLRSAPPGEIPRFEPRPADQQAPRPDLPSRVADGLFWLGRYGERIEGTVRLLRAVHSRITDGSHPGAADELAPLFRLMVWLAMVPQDVANLGDGIASRATRTALRAAVFDLDHPNSLRANAQRLHRAAHSVRDRLALDMWRVVRQIDRLSQPPRRLDAAGMLLLLDDVVTSLAALSGLEQESMTRGPGWRFLDIGRRVERALHMAALVRGTQLAEADGRDERVLTPTLEVLLELGESVLTYRRHHFAAPQRAPVLDLLLVEPTNPRSLCFQLNILSEQLAALPDAPGHGGSGREPANAARSIVGAARDNLRQVDLLRAGPPLSAALHHLVATLPEVSNLLAHAYFSHAFARSA
ncbi:MAG: hypothetical protein GC191_01115 [Azospirillum sp.]|nr:hypothetical protein [Azospirillum sp.]